MKTLFKIFLFIGVVILVIHFWQLRPSTKSEINLPSKSESQNNTLNSNSSFQKKAPITGENKNSSEQYIQHAHWTNFKPKIPAADDARFNDPQFFRKAKREYLSQLPMEKIKINNKEYWLLKNIFAQSLINNNSSLLTSTLDENDLNFLPQKLGPYILFKSGKPDRKLVLKGEPYNREYPVIITDPINGTIGIINGEISFFKIQAIEFEYFTQNYDLSLIKAYRGSLQERGSFLINSDVEIQSLLNLLGANLNINHKKDIDLGITTSFARAN
jgi:hypothetical protein